MRCLKLLAEIWDRLFNTHKLTEKTPRKPITEYGEDEDEWWKDEEYE